MRLFKITGYLSLFFGTLAVLFTFQYFFLALPFAILGYISSIINVFLKTRNEIKTGFFNQGIVGMLLSSVPVGIMIYFIFFATPK